MYTYTYTYTYIYIYRERERDTHIYTTTLRNADFELFEQYQTEQRVHRRSDLRPVVPEKARRPCTDLYRLSICRCFIDFYRCFIDLLQTFIT